MVSDSWHFLLGVQNLIQPDAELAQEFPEPKFFGAYLRFHIYLCALITHTASKRLEVCDPL